jgi:protein subunit release factor B
MLKEYELPEIKSGKRYILQHRPIQMVVLEDCEQTYISGWGPGGQKVNTAQNAAQLRHKPTNIVIKVNSFLYKINSILYFLGTRKSFASR